MKAAKVKELASQRKQSHDFVRVNDKKKTEIYLDDSYKILI